MATWPASVNDADRACAHEGPEQELPELPLEGGLSGYWKARTMRWMARAARGPVLPLYRLRVYRDKSLGICTAELMVLSQKDMFWRVKDYAVVHGDHGIEGAVSVLLGKALT